jgi:double-stranded uracil-DNA glycosylase
MGMILPDVLAPNLKVVFCGTAAGAMSARLGAYYANPTNRFWATLHKIGLTPYQLKPSEFKTVTKYSIGLTDLAKHTSGQDNILSPSDFGVTELREKMLRYQPKVLAFTSKRGAGEYFGQKKVEYGLQAEQIGETRVFVLPSPSGAARSYWDETHWFALAEWLNERTYG